MNKIFNFQSKLLEKTPLTESIYRLKYEVPEGFKFTPGQFIGIRVIPTHTRAYSIVAQLGSVIELLIDIRPGGKASQYFEQVQVGEIVQILGPYGIYRLKDETPNKVFISTGTGIAPFVPMLRSLNLQENHIKFLFGVKFDSHDIAYEYIKDYISDKFEYLQCVSREEPKHLYSRAGRVNIILEELMTNGKLDLVNTEFYICGANEMIEDVVEVLQNNGATRIYFEKYG